MQKYNVEECLDDRNREFYITKIAPFREIEFVSNNDGSKVWVIHYADNVKESTMCVGNDFPNIESFTHEILHLHLSINGFSTFALTVFPFFKNLQDSLLEREETINGIMNATAHFKMFPIFTEQLGMDKGKFFGEDKKYVDEERINSLKEKTNKKLFFTDFIRAFFDIRYEILGEYEEEYKGYNESLQKIDSNLYNVLKTSCELWEGIASFENINFTYSLFEGLEEYIENHL